MRAKWIATMALMPLLATMAAGQTMQNGRFTPEGIERAKARRELQARLGSEVGRLTVEARGFVRQGRWSLAEADVRAVEAYGEAYRREARLLHGEVAFRQGLYNEAAEQFYGTLTHYGPHGYFEPGYPLTPSADVTTYWYVVTLGHLGRRDEATAAMKAAVRVDQIGAYDFPRLPTAGGVTPEAAEATAWYYLARDMYGSGRYPERAEAAAYAYKLAPKNQLVAGEYAEALVKLGRDEEAIPVLKAGVAGPDKDLAEYAANALSYTRARIAKAKAGG